MKRRSIGAVAEVTMLKFQTESVTFSCDAHEAEFVRRVQESAARRLPSLFAADRERILRDRVACAVVMQELDAVRTTRVGLRFGERVRAERKAAGFSQKKLAALSGILRPNIARIERGLHTPSPKTVERVAVALGVCTATLLTASDSDTATA
jgi:ribosome-binding protein aMBF1 (putative translation factor)